MVTASSVRKVPLVCALALAILGSGLTLPANVTDLSARRLILGMAGYDSRVKRTFSVPGCND